MIDLEELKRLYEFRDQAYMDGVAWRDAIAAAFPAIVAKLEAAQRLRDALADCNDAWESLCPVNILAAFDKEQS
mgnify:CR=1 FL=1